MPPRRSDRCAAQPAAEAERHKQSPDVTDRLPDHLQHSGRRLPAGARAARHARQSQPDDRRTGTVS